jgi:hypothetical protein
MVWKVITEHSIDAHMQPKRENMSELKANNYSLVDGQVKPLRIRTELKRWANARLRRYIRTLFWQQALQ